MKLLKMFWHGAPYEYLYPTHSWFNKLVYKLRKFIRKTLILSFIGSSLSLSGFLGALFFSHSDVAYAAPETIIKTVEADAPILERIADCESGINGKPGTGRQFLPSGSIVTNSNTNGTTDVGKYQINMSKEHIIEMAKLGFNPFSLEGNTAYAKFLYANRGTGDWSSSAACWRK